MGTMTRARVALLVISAALAPSLVSCGTKDDATLAVYAQNPALKKSVSPVGFKLEGSVDVVFDMGHYASGSVKVDAVSLRIFDAKNLNVLARAKISPSTTFVLPAELAPSSKITASFTIGIDQLTTQEITDLCAGPLTISGTVTRADTPEPIHIGSNAVSATGCP